MSTGDIYEHRSAYIVSLYLYLPIQLYLEPEFSFPLNLGKSFRILFFFGNSTVVNHSRNKVEVEYKKRGSHNNLRTLHWINQLKIWRGMLFAKYWW